MPTSWAETKVIQAKIGEYITIARLSKSGLWFLASVSRDTCELSITLDFLEKDVTYFFQRYQDVEGDPLAGAMSLGETRKGESYNIKMMVGGGDIAIFAQSPTLFDPPSSPHTSSKVPENPILFSGELYPRNLLPEGLPEDSKRKHQSFLLPPGMST